MRRDLEPVPQVVERAEVAVDRLQHVGCPSQRSRELRLLPPPWVERYQREAKQTRHRHEAPHCGREYVLPFSVRHESTRERADDGSSNDQQHTHSAESSREIPLDAGLKNVPALVRRDGNAQTRKVELYEFDGERHRCGVCVRRYLAQGRNQDRCVPSPQSRGSSDTRRAQVLDRQRNEAEEQEGGQTSHRKHEDVTKHPASSGSDRRNLH